MTRKRDDDHSTEFGLWLRDQEEIDSNLGFVTSNIDYAWRNYETGAWMLLEEKRYRSETKEWQRRVFSVLDKSIIDEKYRGFYLLTFEKTNPNDGWMSLGKLEGIIFPDIRKITVDELIRFLKMEN